MSFAVSWNMTKINSCRDLTVWQVSIELADVCFEIVEAVPYSLGSHGEVETLFEVIHRRKLVPEALLRKGIVLIEPVGKMLHGLEESLEAHLNLPQR